MVQVVDLAEGEEPTVFLRSPRPKAAMAFNERGEIIRTVKFFRYDHEEHLRGKPAWHRGSVVNVSSAGGQDAYDLLYAALTTAEVSAKMRGEEIKRLPYMKLKLEVAA